jgi:hypothetical protein
MDEGMRAWSFLVVEESDRQHRGNEGYDDRPAEYYSWDSTVANHYRPHPGDICVVRDSRGVHGISLIDGIDTTGGVEKSRRRCPDCGSTAFKGRATLSPANRCSRCRAEFDQAEEERIEVTVFRADYGRSWLRVDGAVTAAALEATAYLSHSKQQAIRPVEPDALRSLLAARRILIGAGWWSGGVVTDGREIPAGRRPRNTMGRIGQAEFRRRLLERFGALCAFSGPQPAESLHAAHVTPFARNLRHELAGGLLLRADLHALFDRGLISIDEQLKVRVDPSLRAYRELARLHGSTLRIASDDPLLPRLKTLLEQHKKAL